MQEILIKLRQENRYSQSMLSKVLGISRQAYMKYESGEVEPSIEIVRKLSKIYKVPYDVIIDNKIDSQNQTVESKGFYNFSEEKTLEAASPFVVYGSSYKKNMDEESIASTIQYFQNQLNNLQEVIMEMRYKLSSLSALKTENSVENKPSYSKSKSFNKDDFFKLVGKLNIDSSSIDELRENSLI